MKELNPWLIFQGNEKYDKIANMAQNESGKTAGPEGPPEKAPATEYLKTARALIRGGQHKKAYSVLLKASGIYPTHPIILSYLGWLQAIVDKAYRSGTATCRKAFLHFKTSDRDIASAVYPILYLNLGRAFLLSGRKKDAVESFVKGLSYDRGHSELKREMRSLGVRKQPPLSFLSRSNPLNKYIGILFHANNGKP